jgi:hypothetical protein
VSSLKEPDCSILDILSEQNGALALHFAHSNYSVYLGNVSSSRHQKRKGKMSGSHITPSVFLTTNPRFVTANAYSIEPCWLPILSALFIRSKVASPGALEVLLGEL